jgi:hypothetical protein
MEAFKHNLSPIAIIVIGLSGLECFGTAKLDSKLDLIPQACR